MLTPPRRGEKMLTKLSVDTASSTGSAGGAFLSSSQPQTPTHVGDSPFTSRSNELKVSTSADLPPPNYQKTARMFALRTLISMNKLTLNQILDFDAI